MSSDKVFALIRAEVRNYNVDHDDFEDFVNTCWLASQESIPGFRGGSCGGFIRAIVRNQASNYVRSILSRRRGLQRIEAAVRAAEQASPLSAELKLSVHAAFSTLDPVDQWLIFQHDVLGESLHDAANNINMSPSEAYSRRQSALSELRPLIGARPPRLGMSILVPCALAAACTLLTLEMPSLFSIYSPDLQQAIGCFVRDAPFEQTTYFHAVIPCTRRDRGWAHEAVWHVQYPRSASALLALFDEHLTGQQSARSLLFNDLMRASGENPESWEETIAVIHDRTTRADARLAEPRLALDASAAVAASQWSAAGFLPPAQRSVDALERLAVDYCDDDVGWEIGCDGQELVVAWVILGREYFACGLSPTLEGIVPEAPFEGSLRLSNTLEFGQRPPRVHVFAGIIDIDTGGGTRDEMRSALELTTMAAFILQGESFGDISRDDAYRLRDMFTMAMRISAVENDVREFVDAPHTGEAPLDIDVRRESAGSNLVRFRFSTY